ncbi:glycoside hydrolase family 25 protein [Lactovum odontotermitis]
MIKLSMRKKFTAKSLIILLVALIAGFALIFFVRSNVKHEPGQAYQTLPDLRTDLTKGEADLTAKPVIDLSAFQPYKSIDYTKLAKNISGAVVRVQDGTKAAKSATVNADGSDPAFKYHMTGLQAQGVPVAVYAFANAASVKEMKAEAKAFYERAKAYQPTYWWVDVESASMADLNTGVEAFRAELESLGAKNIGIYSRDNFLTENKIDTGKFDAMWLAYYGQTNDGSYTKLDTARSFQMQQYTDQGKMSGYTATLDLNRVLSQAGYEKIFLNK